MNAPRSVFVSTSFIAGGIGPSCFERRERFVIAHVDFRLFSVLAFSDGYYHSGEAGSIIVGEWLLFGLDEM
jgi:hypothetical protein